MNSHSGFSQTHKVGIIVNFVFPYICYFLLHLQQIMLVNLKLDISEYNMIAFQGYRLYWISSFLMAQLKPSWQYGHFCVVESL